MEQVEYAEDNTAQQSLSRETAADSLTHTTAEREYPATTYVWSLFFIGAAALVVAGIVGGILALLLFNYTSGGFS